MVHKNLLTLSAVLLLSIWTILPLTKQGFFPMHDDVQVVRVQQMHKSLADGMFPVRWVEDLGYGFGYPIFNFYAPLSYYVGGFINFFVNDPLIATKMMIGIGMVLAGVTMYFLAKEFWGEVGGIISALFYVYAPYHALNVYVRGAIAETWAYGFLPLAFYGLYKTYVYFSQGKISTQKAKKEKNAWIYIAVTAAGYAGVILSHNLTAMMISPFLALLFLVLSFDLYKKNKLSAIVYLLFALITGLLLSAFYWLPSLVEMQYTNVSSQVGGGADFPDHFVCAGQLWNSQWAFGGSVPGCIDGLSFRIGKLHIAGLFLMVIGSLLFLRGYKGRLYAVILSAAGFALSIFFMLRYSMFIWEIVGPMEYFQYPWRFLILSSFFTSFLVGGLVYLSAAIVRRKPLTYLPYIVGLMFIILLLGIYGKLFSPQSYLAKSVGDYTKDLAIKYTASKVSDEYLPKGIKKPTDVKQISQAKADSSDRLQVRHIVSKTQENIFQVSAKQSVNLMTNIAYFPAWQAYVDGEKVPINVLDSFIAVPVPEGESEVRLVYRQTPVQKFANILSISGVLLLVIGIISARRKLI